MQIRNGFVSNSSSSSFILLLDHRPETVEDCMRMVFANMSLDEAMEYHITCEYYEEVIHGPQAAKLIFEGINESEKQFKESKDKGWDYGDKVHSLANEIATHFYHADSASGYQCRFTGLLDAEMEILKKTSITRNKAQAADSKYYNELRRKFDKASNYKYDRDDKKAEDKHCKDWEAYRRKDKKCVKLRKEYDDAGKLFENECLQAAMHLMSRWEAKGIFPAFVTFGNEDGTYGALMEMGNAFNRVSHIRTSHH